MNIKKVVVRHIWPWIKFILILIFFLVVLSVVFFLDNVRFVIG